MKQTTFLTFWGKMIQAIIHIAIVSNAVDKNHIFSYKKLNETYTINSSVAYF